MNNFYIEEGKLTYEILDGWWTDAGTFESLLRANMLVAETGANKLRRADGESDRGPGSAAMKILITGEAGFIGSNFICHVLAERPDYELINYDKLTYAGNLEDVAENANYTFIKGDICDAGSVEAAMRRCDAVVRFARNRTSIEVLLPAFDHAFFE